MIVNYLTITLSTTCSGNCTIEINKGIYIVKVSAGTESKVERVIVK